MKEAAADSAGPVDVLVGNVGDLVRRVPFAQFESRAGGTK